MKGRFMQRWRDPSKDPRQEPKSNVITREGYEHLQQLINHLIRERRPYYSQKVNEAAAQGDRSENADYQYNKRELNKTIARIAYLTKRLRSVKIIEQLPSDQSRIYFGAYVTLTTSEDKELSIRLVGPDESDLQASYISIDSPLARALLTKKAGESITLMTTKKQQIYQIIKLCYH